MKYYLKEKQVAKLNYYLLLYFVYYIISAIGFYILIPQVYNIFLVFVPITVFIFYLFLLIEEKLSDKIWQREFSSEGIITSFKEPSSWRDFKSIKYKKILGCEIITFKGKSFGHNLNIVKSYYNDSELKYVFNHFISNEIDYKTSLMKIFEDVDESEPEYKNLQETPKNFILLRLVMLPIYAFIIVSIGRFLRDYI